MSPRVIDDRPSCAGPVGAWGGLGGHFGAPQMEIA
jgi:hypothetical protein